MLIIYLCPGHTEAAGYHIDETLTRASISYHLIAQKKDRISLQSVAPFVITHNEKGRFAVRED